MKLLPVNCAKHLKQDTDCSRKEGLGEWSNIPWEFKQLKYHQATLQTQVTALYPPVGTLQQLFNQVLGILTVSKHDAVPCKNHNWNNLSFFSNRTKANKQHHTGIQYLLQCKPRTSKSSTASPLPSGSGAVIKLSLPNISKSHETPTRVCAGRSLLLVQQGKGETVLLRLLRKSSSVKLLPLD